MSSLFSASDAEAEGIERPVLWHRKDEFNNRADPELLTCKRSYPAARKLQRVFVRVEAGMEVDNEEEEEDSGEKFYMLAVLADFVEDKHISLDILSLESTCERSVVHDWVKSCRRWRCQTLEIVGGLYTNDPFIQSCIDTVVSQLPARDLTPGMYLRSRLCGRGALMEERKWRNQWYDLDASLQISTDQHDEVGYDVARDKMIQFIRKWAAVMFEKRKRGLWNLFMLHNEQPIRNFNVSRRCMSYGSLLWGR